MYSLLQKVFVQAKFWFDFYSFGGKTSILNPVSSHLQISLLCTTHITRISCWFEYIHMIQCINEATTTTTITATKLIQTETKTPLEMQAHSVCIGKFAIKPIGNKNWTMKAETEQREQTKERTHKCKLLNLTFRLCGYVKRHKCEFQLLMCTPHPPFSFTIILVNLLFFFPAHVYAFQIYIFQIHVQDAVDI